MVEEISARFDEALGSNDIQGLNSLMLEAQRKGFGRRLGDVMW